MRPSIQTALVLTAGALTAGCSSLLTSNAPAETVYRLEAPAVPTSGSGDGPSIGLRVRATPGLDTDRLLRSEGATLKPYADARWADNLPEVLAAVLRTVLEDSGRFGRVSGEPGPRSDWQLELEVHAFFATAAGQGAAAPSLDVALRGYLQCDGRTFPVRIESRAQASQNRLWPIVAGFQSAVDSASVMLLNQLSGRCGDADGSVPPPQGADDRA
jgi:ABC-type uncharacterized transport system auxiliary subunit